jgi:hypothetical protein
MRLVRGRFGDGGQAVPAVALVFLVLVVASSVVVRLAGATVDRARARTAADAAALAAAGADDDAAAALADQNGGALVRVTRVGHEVEVVVQVGGARATARATHESAAATVDEGP